MNNDNERPVALELSEGKPAAEDNIPVAAAGISEAKLVANRLNAKKSTGPRTAAGKNKSKFNALKHGLRAKDIVVANEFGGESKAAFEELLGQLLEALQPQGVLEEMLVARIAVCQWRLKRALNYETWLLLDQLDSAQDKLEVSDPAMFLHDYAMDPLLRYETTFDRQLHRAIDELQELQRQRKAKPVTPLMKGDISGQN